jgi:phage-related minor tail protein
MDGKIVITGDASQLRTEMQKAADAVRGFGSEAGNQLGKTAGHMDHLNLSTVAARRELLVLAHEASQGNWKNFGGSLMVLGERMDAMSLIFSAGGAAVGATVGIMGAFALAAIKGTEESKAFATAMQLTGNYAGLTEGRFNEMARTMADGSHTGIGTARQALQEMVASGRFTGDMLNTVGQTALTFSHMTGQSSADVVKDFAAMADGVAKWAEEHNKQYHFLTGAQYQHIEMLEREGQTQQAMQATMDAFNDHLRTQTQNVGYLESAWHKAKDAMGDFWDRMKAVGRDTTIDDQIAAAQAQLVNLQNRANASQGTREGSHLQDSIAAAQGALTQLQAQKDLQESDKKSAALADQLHEKAIRAVKDNEALAKSVESRKQQGDAAVKKYLADQQAMVADGMSADSAEKQAAMIAAIREKYKEPKQHHDNTQIREWQTELEEFKLVQQEKAQQEGRFYETSKQEEKSFWEQKLALTQKGSREQTAVRRQLAQLGLGIMKEQYDTEQAGLKLGMEASKDAYAARAIYIQRYVDNARQRYGEDSAQYKAALQEQETMRREHDAKLRQLEQIRLADTRSNSEAVIEESQRIAQMDYDLGLLTRAKLLEIQRGYIVEKMQLELDSANDEVKLYQADTVEYEKALAKKKAIERKYSGQLSQNKNDQTVEQHKPQTSIIGSAQSSIDQNFASMLTRAQSFQQAMAGISKNVGMTMVQEMVTKPFAEWVAGWLRKLAMNLGFLTQEKGQETASAATGAIEKKVVSLGEVMANAAIAASGAYAATAAIPYVGPMLAPAAAATAFAGASSYGAALFSASGGFDIPSGMNPMTQLHAEEMVLPAKYANLVRNMADSGGQVGETVHNHFHLSALDMSGADRFFRNNAKTIANVMRDHAKKQ